LNIREVTTEVLVVGAGGAGARAALECAYRSVPCIMASKGPFARSGITPLAQNVLTAALGHEDERDSSYHHLKDMVQAGSYLSDQNLAEVLAEEAPERVKELEKYGVRLAKKGDKFYQSLSPGNTFARSLYVYGGGHGIMKGLQREVLRYGEWIDLWEDVMVTKLLVQNNQVMGALLLDLKEGEIVLVRCKAIILATGGCGQLWSLTDTPPESVGDGIYLAYHAGAELVDMEQMLWYASVICHPSSLRGTIIPYENLIRPELCHGKLLNTDGEELVDPGNLPTRDVVIAIVLQEIKEGRGTENNGIYLDLASSPKGSDEVESILKQMVPDKYRYIKKAGVDLAREKVEIAPAAHFTLGGISINQKSETSVKGLFAAGETTGNLHGANRVSGNALAEILVFGKKAGRAATEFAPDEPYASIDYEEIEQEQRVLMGFVGGNQTGAPHEIKDSIKSIMDEYAGFNRQADGLEEALKQLNRIKHEQFPMVAAPDIRRYNLGWQEMIEARSMLEVAEMIIRGARLRTETRGHHRRMDFPETDHQNWIKHTSLKKAGTKVKEDTRPVVITQIPIPSGKDE